MRLPVRGDGPAGRAQPGNLAPPHVIAGLWSRGSGLDAGKRFLAAQVDSDPSWQRFSWPLDVPLESIALSTPEQVANANYGQGILATGDDAARLQALRDQYLEADVSKTYWFISVETDGGALFNVFVRDVLPFENDAGLVRP